MGNEQRFMDFIDLPLSWEDQFADRASEGEHVDNIPDALVKCLVTLGRVDIEYIGKITGEDYSSVISALRGSIFQNPDTWETCYYKGWETSEEYLSGNLSSKLKAAVKANKIYRGRFNDNIIAIRKVLPPSVAYQDIYITLGSPWLPADVIDDFILEVFGDPIPHYFSNRHRKAIMENWKTRHDELTGVWEIPAKGRYTHSVSVANTYGTRRLEALYILEDTLNMKTIKVTDEVSCVTNESGVKRVVNRKETVAAIERQKTLTKAFQDWIWADEKRKARLERIFEERFSSVRRRVYDGSFLTFPTMSSDIELYPYQKNAVARMIFSPNTLLAHDVGAGKTFEMIAAGQELRRMGLSKKNMYVVPNNITGQWESIFRKMYPEARVLVVDAKSFEPKKREALLEDIRDNDYDGIIIAYSCFDMIPLSKAYHIECLKEKIDDIAERISADPNAATVLKTRKKKLEKELIKLRDEKDGSRCGIFFEDLGITRLFVDEAHNYKNVPVETRTGHVLGINKAGSKKCKEMMEKVRFIQRKNDGRGVVFATGTPITNSITDAFVMQLYLQSGELALLDLQNFDSWIGMFAESVTEFEIDVDTSSYRLATRFAKFHNLPELTTLLSSIADFHTVDPSSGIPLHDGYEDTLLDKTEEFEAYLKLISERADNVRQGKVKRTEDNMLKITTDGRKAALDMRLVDPKSMFCTSNKVARCAANVLRIYRKTSESKSTQLVFCDSSTPKEGFNIYDELRTWLVLYGIPADEIAFIHDADCERKRAALFTKVRKGSVRVLIGSTSKLGLGVNIQDKLIALHHLDVPWRPADMTQREGRILRQGNTNSKVQIFRYITEGSFDAYSWQLLETKQRFISGLLSGSITDRSNSDIEDTVLNYAEVKALAVGNSLVKERVEAANELTRYTALQNKLTESRIAMERELMELPSKIDYQQKLVFDCEEDAAYSKWWTKMHPVPFTASEKKAEAEGRRIIRDKIDSALRDNTLYEAERKILIYRGFDVVLPSNMTLDKPYILLVREGRYSVELGEKEVGNLIRIDNFIDKLDEYLGQLRSAHSALVKRMSDIEVELSKNENYKDQIDYFRSRVEQIDKELGVTGDE